MNLKHVYTDRTFYYYYYHYYCYCIVIVKLKRVAGKNELAKLAWYIRRWEMVQE